MIHISTDYVFDGTSPPYKVGDKCNPLSKYGLTKMESEEAVLAAAPGWQKNKGFQYSFYFILFGSKCCRILCYGKFVPLTIFFFAHE